MRFRLFLASIAAACALALCAVPAFADDTEQVEVTIDASDVTITYTTSGEHYGLTVGSYSGDGGVYLVCIGTQTASGYWQTSSSGSYVDSTVPASSGTFFLDPAVSSYARVATYYLDESGVQHYVRVIYHVNHFGTDNDMTGVFGSASSGMGAVLDWVNSWLNAILDQPVLLFFCIALVLLTIGITIIKRLLSVRA